MTLSLVEQPAPEDLVDDPLMNVEQAAAYLAIPKATLYTWRTTRPGYGPVGVKVGSSLRYRRSVINAWIREHTEVVSPDAVDIDGEEVFDGRGKAAGANSLPAPMTRKSRPRKRA